MEGRGGGHGCLCFLFLSVTEVINCPHYVKFVLYAGRCNASALKEHMTPHLEWAYDYCPSQYAWMAIFGLVLYLAFFAPGKQKKKKEKKKKKKKKEKKKRRKKVMAILSLNKFKL